MVIFAFRRDTRYLNAARKTSTARAIALMVDAAGAMRGRPAGAGPHLTRDATDSKGNSVCGQHNNHSLLREFHTTARDRLCSGEIHEAGNTCCQRPAVIICTRTKQLQDSN